MSGEGRIEAADGSQHEALRYYNWNHRIRVRRLRVYRGLIEPCFPPSFRTSAQLSSAQLSSDPIRSAAASF